MPTQLWERSDDQVYLDEERTRELEALFEADVEKGELRGVNKGSRGGGEEGAEEGAGGDGECVFVGVRAGGRRGRGVW